MELIGTDLAEFEAKLMAQAQEWYDKNHKLSAQNGMGPLTVGHQAEQTVTAYFRHRGWSFKDIVEKDFGLTSIPESTWNLLSTSGLHIPNAKGIPVEDRKQLLIFTIYTIASREGWKDPMGLFV